MRNSSLKDKRDLLKATLKTIFNGLDRIVKMPSRFATEFNIKTCRHHLDFIVIGQTTEKITMQETRKKFTMP